MSEKLDFLTQPSARRLRKEIQNICDSYSHPWDVLAELAQNAVDAINLHRINYGNLAQQLHKISIQLDRRSRSIKIRDTGVGFPPEKVISLVAPHESGKEEYGNDQIGQKGVGLTYVIFMCNSFSLRSRSVSGDFAGKIINGISWKTGSINETPSLEVIENTQVSYEPSETFTEIVLEGIEDSAWDAEGDIFNQSFEVLEFLIRTKTAIGSTRAIFGDTQDTIKIDLGLLSPDGSSELREINFSYLLPQDLLSRDDIVSFNDFMAEAALLDDRQKTKKLQGKCLVDQGSINRAGRNIKFHVFFAPSSKFWKDVSVKNELVSASTSAEDQSYLYKAGIYLATRGMPTGIEMNSPKTGASGYWGNTFILLEDDSLTFDLGRKSVPGRTQGLLKDISRELFNKITKLSNYLSSDPPIASTVSSVLSKKKQEVFEELNALPNLPISSLRFKKNPDDQEAAVSALFHELIGNSTLKGYSVLKVGYKMTYDLWGYYEADKSHIGSNHRDRIRDNSLIPIVIEFKYKAETILDDLESNKFFSDIDLLVCWEIDEKKFAKERVMVEILKPDDKFYHGSNYILEWPGAYNLGAAGTKHVIVLKQLLDDLARGHAI